MTDQSSGGSDERTNGAKGERVRAEGGYPGHPRGEAGREPRGAGVLQEILRRVRQRAQETVGDFGPRGGPVWRDGTLVVRYPLHILVDTHGRIIWRRTDN